MRSKVKATIGDGMMVALALYLGITTQYPDFLLGFVIGIVVGVLLFVNIVRWFYK